MLCCAVVGTLESFWMVFGSDDAALRAAAEPHISLILELNFYRPMFAAFFFLRYAFCAANLSTSLHLFVKALDEGYAKAWRRKKKRSTLPHHMDI
jgi:hypothetical protein